jgi:methyltransferase (TIGR00027 family)
MDQDNHSKNVAADRFTILRALGHRETDEKIRCMDGLAQFFLDEDWSEAIRFHKPMLKRFESSAPGAYGYCLARTRFMDEQLEEAISDGISQVVILGSGFDTRAYRVNQEDPVSFFELDRRAVHLEKQARATHPEIPETNHCIFRIPVDFDKNNIESFLNSLDIDYTKPTAILIEGLLYYMPEDFFLSLLSFCHNILPSKSRLIFDYALNDLLQLDNGMYGGKEVNEFAQNSDERFRYTTIPEQLTQLLSSSDFSIRKDMGHEDMSDQFLMDSSGELVASPMGGFRLCCACKNGTAHRTI